MLPKHSLFYFIGPLAVILRCLGKCIAILNACWIVITSTLQFTKLFDNCWCGSVVPQLGASYGWIVVFASEAQVTAASYKAWCGGLVISLICVFLFTVFVLVGWGGGTAGKNEEE